MNFGDWASLLSTVSVAIVVLLNMRNLSKPREDILVRLARIEASWARWKRASRAPTSALTP